MACRTTSVLSGTGRGYAGKKETVGRRGGGGTHGSNRILGGDLTVAKARGTRRRVEERGGEWACRARVSAALPLVCRGVRACSVPLGLARVRKLVHVDQEEVRKLKRGSLGHERAFRDAFVQWLPCGPARRPSRGGGARCSPSDDQVNAPIEMV
ncbi:hypothetical protein GW17_00062477 [Ensete ventricosum]|nr:hypothetical protein GW17_00062477 [Ensete ventricosum]